jgi:hypothetical protein
MDFSFSPDEKVSISGSRKQVKRDGAITCGFPQRFVLAEIIKSSTIDVDSLVAFIAVNRVSPDWMSMQLPRG